MAPDCCEKKAKDFRFQRKLPPSDASSDDGDHEYNPQPLSIASSLFSAMAPSSPSSSAAAAGTPSALPRFAIAAAIGFAALALEALRRHQRGPVRNTPPIPAEEPHHVFFGKGQLPDSESAKLAPDALLDPPVNREDEFFWIRDDTRKSTRVLDHLRQENAFTNYKTLPLTKLKNRIYKELLSHLKETDSTVPAPRGKFAYYSRTVAGKSYKFYCRRPVLTDGSFGEEDVLLDVNSLASRLKYCEVGTADVSPDDRYLAYSVDTSGYETYEIRFVDMKTRQLLDSKLVVSGTTGSFEWGVDSSQIFYQTMDDAHRPHKAWVREMDLSKAEQPSSAFKDTCLFTEDNTEHYVYTIKSRSARAVLIGTEASTTSEFYLVDLQSPSGLSARLVRARKPNVLYDVGHAHDDVLYIVTNEGGATNFKLMTANMANPSEWSPLLPYDDGRKIDGISSFKDYAVLTGREGGYKQMWVVPGHDVSRMYQVPTDDVAHVLESVSNMEYDSQVFRYSYMSLTTPRRILEINMETGKPNTLKNYEVPKYDPSLYATERLEAVSTDGEKIPISLVYRKDLAQKKTTTSGENADGTATGTADDDDSDEDMPTPRPMLLYGYGSYEISMEPQFSMPRLPLLDRGVVYAIAHVRGGGEYGRQWYEAARFHTKKKTFDDFVSCAQHLVDCGRTRPNMLAIEGRSAGGLLVGASLNMRPDLFRAAIAGVPFVDIMNTMSDASLPLTTGEWQEWGNPHTREYYNTMAEYCPYSNIAPNKYPAVLALGGLYDPRVHYCEPAKFVAKLRKYNKGTNDILLKVDLSSGHFSASNRYQYLKERAFELSWVLNEIGATHQKIES